MGSSVISPQPARITALEESLRVTREELREVRVRMIALEVLTAHLRPRLPSKVPVQAREAGQGEGR